MACRKQISSLVFWNAKTKICNQAAKQVSLDLFFYYVYFTQLARNQYINMEGRNIQFDNRPPVEAQADSVLAATFKEAARGGEAFTLDTLEGAFKRVSEKAREVPGMSRKGVKLAEKKLKPVGKRIKDVKIARLSSSTNSSGEGVAGLWNGKHIFISDKLIEQAVRDGGKVSMDTLEAVKLHEEYHKQHKHEEPLKAGRTAKSNTIVTIGGIDFTGTELREGINTIDTGDKLPEHMRAKSYLAHADKLQKAVAASSRGISLRDVRRAINDHKDMSKIEDLAIAA